MNNLFDFNQWKQNLKINEAEEINGKMTSKKSKRAKWTNIDIVPSDDPEKNGSIAIEVEGELDKYTQGEVLDILADDYAMIVTITGKNNTNDFFEKIKNNGTLDAAIKLKNASNGLDDAKPISYEFTDTCSIKTIELNKENHKGIVLNNDELDKNNEIIKRIFELTPGKKSDDEEKNNSGGGFGKGEILLASFYNNVKRSLEKRSGGDFGDCTVVADGETSGYLEVKTHGAGFDTYKVGRGEKLTNDDIEKLKTLFSLKLKKNPTVETLFANGTFKDFGEENKDINDDIKLILAKFLLSSIAKYGIQRKSKEHKLDLVFFDDKTCEGNSVKYVNVSVEDDNVAKILENISDKLRTVNIKFTKNVAKDIIKLQNTLKKEIVSSIKGGGRGAPTKNMYDVAETKIGEEIINNPKKLYNILKTIKQCKISVTIPDNDNFDIKFEMV